MVTIAIASKGTPSLVNSSLIIAAFLQRDNILLDIDMRAQNTLNDDHHATIVLTLPDGSVLKDREVLEHLPKLASNASAFSILPIAQEWISRSAAFSTTDFQKLQASLEELDSHLTLRSYVVGYQVNCADLVVWAALSSSPAALSWIRKRQNNVSRWYHFIESSSPWIRDILKEYQTMTSSNKAVSHATAPPARVNYDIDLPPEVTGPIVTRFPPEPSGYLHIGHAKAALLNEYFARKSEGGRLICRFDDTNPSKESSKFQDSILDDLKSIGVIPDTITFSSDNFQTMHDFAVQLIKDGKAFADDSELGKGDEERKNRLPSKRRDMDIEKTLARFAEMKSGSAEGCKWALRARIAYDSPNGTLRDPVIYRCNLTPHHRTGLTWKIYPTYDFCAPILDSVEGVTLALRTNEYRDRNAQYEWFQQALGLRPVPIWDFSRLNLVRTVLSKRKLTRIVNDGRVWGWDDPRMPTIRGILRRGESPSALREFILRQGPSRNVVNMQWGSFWATNRKHIDPTAPRHTAVVLKDAVTCLIQGGPASRLVETKQKHPKNPALGEKTVIFTQKIWIEQADVATFGNDEEITLMSWGNAIVRTILRDDQGLVVSANLELHLSGDVKKTKKITWLADSSENLIPIDLVSFDHLITKDKLEKGDELEEHLSPQTEFRTAAHADCNVAHLSRGAIVQFERKGFYRLDAAYRGDGTKTVFFEVPTK